MVQENNRKRPSGWISLRPHPRCYYQMLVTPSGLGSRLASAHSLDTPCGMGSVRSNPPTSTLSWLTNPNCDILWSTRTAFMDLLISSRLPSPLLPHPRCLAFTSTDSLAVVSALNTDVSVGRNHYSGKNFTTGELLSYIGCGTSRFIGTHLRIQCSLSVVSGS